MEIAVAIIGLATGITIGTLLGTIRHRIVMRQLLDGLPPRLTEEPS